MAAQCKILILCVIFALFLGCEFSFYQNFQYPIPTQPPKPQPGTQTNIYTAHPQAARQGTSKAKAQIDVDKISIQDICEYFFESDMRDNCINFFDNSDKEKE